MESWLKLLEFLQTAGPGAGLGLSAGLLVLLLGVMTNKLVTWGRFQDMVTQRDKAERRVENAEKERDVMRRERDELRIMMAGALNLTRKNAHLATSVMVRSLQREDVPPDDDAAAA